MHGANDTVRLGCEEGLEAVFLLGRLVVLRAAHARPRPLDPSKGEQHPVLGRANHTGVLRGFVSADSLNGDTSIRQRCSSFGQGRQYGDFTFRTFVTGC